MAVVGTIGYEDPGNASSFLTGRTTLNVTDTATADGRLYKVKMYKKAPAGQIKVSSWESGGVDYYRRDYKIVSAPAGEGIIELDIPGGIHLQTGWYIGAYLGDFELKGGGGSFHKFIAVVGDLSFITGPVASGKNAPTLGGDLETPLPTGDPYKGKLGRYYTIQEASNKIADDLE